MVLEEIEDRWNRFVCGSAFWRGYWVHRTSIERSRYWGRW